MVAVSIKSPGFFFALRRAENLITQSDLAKICGVTQSTVAQWERGYSVVPAQYLRILREALSMNVEEFYIEFELYLNQIINLRGGNRITRAANKRAKLAMNAGDDFDAEEF